MVYPTTFNIPDHVKTRFNEFAEKVKNLKTKPNDDELLVLYGLYKQATVGDVNTARPGMFELKAKAKWDAWNERKGIGQEEAMEKYIEYVVSLVAQYGV